MLGHGAKFGQKMEQAIAALLCHGSVEAAARAVGINPNTLLRWMKEPEFKAALWEARCTVASQAMGRLQDAMGAAVTTVLKIMLDLNAPAGTRLRAAEIVLEQGTGEMEDIEDRVTELERTARSARKSRKCSADLTLLNTTPLPGPTTTQAQIAAPRLDSAETDEDVVE
jgi:transposase-like protein